jgi:hypothetical protein
MKWFVLGSLFILSLLPFVWPERAFAQSVEGEVVSEPICFFVKNTTDSKVYGTFITNYFTNEQGVRARHRSNFRLENAGTVSDEPGENGELYPIDVAEFCSYGPFYPGRKLHLTLRTLIPIFDCKTRVDQGPIVIKAEPKPDGGTRTYAECFD